MLILVRLSEGVSLTPVLVMEIKGFFPCRALTIFRFCSRDTRAYTLVV
jgi:hypothetical protein